MGDGNNMMMWHTTSEWFQLYKAEGSFLINVYDNRALTVTDSRDNEGANVSIEEISDTSNQKWTILYLDTMEATRTHGFNSDFGLYINRPFYIISRMWMNRTITAVGETNLVIKNKVDGKNTQKFVFDQSSKTIKSVGFYSKSIEIINDGLGPNIEIWKTNARWFQLFRYVEPYIINQKGLVVDVKESLDNENS